VNVIKPNILLNHIDLLQKLDLVDTVTGTNISGNRGYFLKNFGVKLNMALISYAMNFLEQKKYQFMITPHIVNNEVMQNVAQLSEYTETLYKLENYDKYLIATSEQPLTAYYQNKVLNELPVKFCGVSNCFRKETGSHGKNTNGIFRVHEFQKLEQFCITDKDSSWGMFNEMIDVCKEFYDSLGISYKVINIVSGALNNAASMKYDLEAFFPGSNEYFELVSCTNTIDYFSDRLNIKDNKKNSVHMLNCTLFANTRTICCLAETWQTETGMIIPDVLKKYMNIDEIKFTK